MTPRRLAGLCCLLGGTAWAVRWLLGPDGGTADALRLAGLGLLTSGVAIGAGSLGGRGHWWLRAIAAVGAVALAWSVVDIVRPPGEGMAFDGTLGLVALAFGALAVATGRERVPRRSAGAHAR